mgnify:CR=1 FL=1
MNEAIVKIPNPDHEAYTMVNGILGGSFTADQIIVADLNSDGVINVIDIVSLVNIILD